MDAQAVLRELAALGTAAIKKRYIGSGAREPVFGVATGAMKPLAKQTGKDQALAEALYATGNYDAMYFAGVIAEPGRMTMEDFNRWMDGAYFFMLSDFVVAVTLAEAAIAETVAAAWLESPRNLTVSGGWNCWTWLVGWKPDAAFDPAVMQSLLDRARTDIVSHDGRARVAIRDFIIAAGVSYKPLHEDALALGSDVDALVLEYEDTKCFSGIAAAIRTQADKGRIGFKRKNVRC